MSASDFFVEGVQTELRRVPVAGYIVITDFAQNLRRYCFDLFSLTRALVIGVVVALIVFYVCHST